MPVEKWAGLLLIQVHKPWVVFIHRHLVIVSINCKRTGLSKIKQGWDSVREWMYMYSKWYGERLLVSFPRNNVTEAKNILFGIANTEKGGVLRKNYASYDPCYSFSNDFMAGFFRSLYKIDGDAQELGS